MSDTSLTSLIAQSSGLDQGFVFCDQDDFDSGASFSFFVATSQHPLFYNRKDKLFHAQGGEAFYGSSPVKIEDHGTHATYCQNNSYGTSVSLTIFADNAKEEAIDYLMHRIAKNHSCLTFAAVVEALFVLTNQDKDAFSAKLLEAAYLLTDI